jgi:hypothetical protein
MFQRRTQGWDNLDVASGNPYAGGDYHKRRLHGFDAQFDIGLASVGSAPPVVDTLPFLTSQIRSDGTW